MEVRIYRKKYRKKGLEKPLILGVSHDFSDGANSVPVTTISNNPYHYKCEDCIPCGAPTVEVGKIGPRHCKCKDCE